MFKSKFYAFCDPEVIPKVFNTKVLTAEDILRKLSVTKEEQEDIEKKTRDQSDNALWFTERQIRPNVTNYSTDRTDRSTSQVCHLSETFFTYLHTPKAIQWGKDNEEPVRIAYEKHMQSNGHPSLHTKKAGFMVDIEKSWLGISPDAWVHDPSVDCTDGIAEFMCPYTMADKTPEEMCDQKGFYLVSLNGIPCLKQNHEYYHQVQLQLYVNRSMTQWCDFF